MFPPFGLCLNQINQCSNHYNFQPASVPLNDLFLFHTPPATDFGAHLNKHELATLLQKCHTFNALNQPMTSETAPISAAASANESRQGARGLVTASASCHLNDNDVHIPPGHVLRLKRRLAATVGAKTSAAASASVPSDLRRLPSQIAGAEQLFGGLFTSPPPPPQQQMTAAAALLPPPPARPSFSGQFLSRSPSVRSDPLESTAALLSMRRAVAQMAAATALQRSRRPCEHVVGENLPTDTTAGCQHRNCQQAIPVSSKSVHTQTDHPLHPDRHNQQQQQPAQRWYDIHPHSQPPQHRQHFRTPLEHESGAGTLSHAASSLMRDLFDPRTTALTLNSLSVSSSGIGDEEEEEEQVDAEDDFIPRADCRVCSRQHVGDQGTRQAALPPWVPHYMREIVKVIQEEVSSVMQKEMQKALEAHRDLIRATMAVETTATSVIVPASGLPSADPDARQSSSGNSTFPRAMAASSVKPEVPVPGYEAVSKTAATATPPPPPPPTEPTFTPEQSTSMDTVITEVILNDVKEHLAVDGVRSLPSDWLLSINCRQFLKVAIGAVCYIGNVFSHVTISVEFADLS
ncbi:unnamed protein product [Schistocephalus solidus]|uniref:Uncharacterized protein n=1 Tax=Schistocephalus solidus TaxID=70667 RepID=A0A183TLA8_SCHSO|nr:unnamed protein product [Schistocephalus solidus]